MPSPFPGMDPYLENPDLWPDVHGRIITYIADELNEVLPSGYVARGELRTYIVQPDRHTAPDVTVLKQSIAGQPRLLETRTNASPVAVATYTPSFRVSVPAFEVSERYIDILFAGDKNRVVTSIELLSPANKMRGSSGRAAYLTKQREMLESQIHLIEIDLLRVGAHTLPVPPDLLLPLGPWNYLISLHRAEDGSTFDVWPNSIREPLPQIRVPLSDPDEFSVLDLQTIFTRCYDRGRYAPDLDYLQAPNPPLLNAEDAAWADALLREKGLR